MRENIRSIEDQNIDSGRYGQHAGGSQNLDEPLSARPVAVN